MTMAKKTKEDKKPRVKRGKKGEVSSGPPAKIAVAVIEESLEHFSVSSYERYGNAVLEDRAIPDYRDGMNPVNRRILWAAHELGTHSNKPHMKAARIVGDAMGRFHPHGDSAIYGAMVGMANNEGKVNNTCHALIDGEGNWGSLSEPGYAAMRYTEARLSKFADAVLFDKFYLPVMEMVPNYDSKDVEPLTLPALIPLLFLNGRFGIAPGATANIPSFDGKTVLKVLEAAYSGEELTPKLLAKTLRVVGTYGGRETGKNDEHRKALFSTKRGRVELHSESHYDEKKRTLTFTTFAYSSMLKALEKIAAFDGVQTVMDDSDTEDRYGKMVVVFKKQADNRLQRLVEKCKAIMTARESYVLNFTRRYKDETGQAAAKMKAMTLPKVLTLWVKWRVSLEKKACAYWIKQDEKEIHRLSLLIQAVDLIDFIMKILKDKKLKTNDEVYRVYAKKAKVEVEDAKYVLGRPIISLRNMSRNDLLADRKKVEKNKSGLEKRMKKPMGYLIKQLDDFRPFFKD